MSEYKAFAIASYVWAGGIFGSLWLGIFILTGKDAPIARYGIIASVGAGVVANIVL